MHTFLTYHPYFTFSCIYLLSIGLLQIPPGFAEGMRFDDQACSGFTAVQATTKENQVVAISRLLLGGGNLEVAERLNDTHEEMIKVIDCIHVCMGMHACTYWRIPQLCSPPPCIFSQVPTYRIHANFCWIKISPSPCSYVPL